MPDFFLEILSKHPSGRLGSGRATHLLGVCTFAGTYANSLFQYQFNIILRCEACNTSCNIVI